jgi:hypothetical protein
MWVPTNVCGYLLTLSDDACGDIVDANIWNFACDTANNWYDKQVEASKSNQAITDHHAQYDAVDCYEINSQKYIRLLNKMFVPCRELNIGSVG